MGKCEGAAEQLSRTTTVDASSFLLQNECDDRSLENRDPSGLQKLARRQKLAHPQNKKNS